MRTGTNHIALQIDRLHQQDKLPVVVGGTAYYSTALLFKDLLPSTSSSIPDTHLTEAPTQEEVDPRLDLPTAELYETLKKVDPVMATRWHPRDRRKIRRSLQLYYSTGLLQSDLYSQQREEGRIGPGQVRYPTLIIWLWSEQSGLDLRLDARIEEMVRIGLFTEIQTLYDTHASPDSIDFTKGIYQAIGFKEFYPYLKSGSIKDREIGMELMKAATRRYARKQIKWIRNKLLGQCRQAGDQVQVVVLDATDLKSWEDRVLKPGIKALDAFLTADTIKKSFDPLHHTDVALQSLLIPSQTEEFSSRPEIWSFHACPMCPGISTNSEAGWQEHLTSRGHRSQLKRREKREAFEAWKLQQANKSNDVVDLVE